jgi:Molybdopterin-guanine dinucleotide biosynthesis protein
MRAFSVFGITKSGKTTTIENIISELRRRKNNVFLLGGLRVLKKEDILQGGC